MPGRIFISYRRDDSRADARSIYQRLERTFGSRRLFMDVDTIQKGRDFTKVLEEHLALSDVMLVVIGSKWLSIADESGRRRIDNPEDFVHLEVASALKRDIAVIPVLLDGARMPSADELPPDLKPLTKRQASIVTHETFARDVDGLARDINALHGGKPRRRWMGAVAAATMLAIGAAAFVALAPTPEPASAPPPDSTARAPEVPPPAPPPRTAAVTDDAVPAAPASRGSEGEVRLTLSKIEPAGSACRLYLVVENRHAQELSAIKLDFVGFNVEGEIFKRVLLDLAPLRAGKRSVKMFDLVNQDCQSIASFLVNDVTVCEDGTGPMDGCLDRLQVSSETRVSLSK